MIFLHYVGFERFFTGYEPKRFDAAYVLHDFASLLDYCVYSLTLSSV